MKIELDYTERPDEPQDSYLVKELIQFSNSPQSRSFYLKAIGQLGEDFVYGILSEAKMLYNEGRITDKAKYLTALLKKELPTEEKKQSAISKHKSKSEIVDLLELNSKDIEKANFQKSPLFMPVPYSNRSIQIPHFLSEAFFTLPSDSRKSDKISTFISINGEPHKVSMLRGKMDPRDKERGMLTTEHLRILGSLENTWITQGGKYLREKNDESFNVCYCEMELRELAKMLGFKRFGGKDEKFLIQKIFDLTSTGFYLELEKDGNNKTGVGFKILGDVCIKNETKNGKLRTIAKVMFSEAWSRISLQRKCVSRQLEIVNISNPLALKVYMFIYPRLVIRNHYKVLLSDLVRNLSLPPAQWHNENKERRKYFLKIIEHLNGKLINSKKLSCSVITENKSHFLNTVLN